MNEELGTCLYSATPHERITFRMATVSPQPYSHYCGGWWQPLPAPSETHSECEHEWETICIICKKEIGRD